MARLILGAVLAAALSAACSQGAPGGSGAGRGRAVYAGPARGLRAAADGSALAFLTDCAEVKAPFLPQGTASCALRLAPTAGGEGRRVADSVTTLPHGLQWSPSGAVLAALAGYDYAAGSGTLILVRDGTAREVAREVTFHGFLPGAAPRVGAIAGGRLVLAGPEGAPEVVAGAESLSTFEFAPGKGEDPRALLRRPASAGGALLALEAGRVRPIAAATGEYAFAPGGAAFAYTAQTKDGYALTLVRGGAVTAAGRQVHAFAFAPDGSAIAFTAEAQPGGQGNLHLAPVAGGPDARLAQDVGEFRWAAHAPRLAWLERYDPRVRSGTLGAGGPGRAPRALARNVSEFDVSSDGAHVAFLQHTARGGYSVDLGLVNLDGGAGAPAALAQGVFGFAFSPDAKWLYYRTRCTRNAEACDLERVPAAGLAPGAKPEPIARGVKSFDFDPRDPGRVLVGFQRMDLAALDLAVWSGGKLTAIDQAVLPGSAQFLGPDGRRVAYVVVAPKRAGVYVADVP